jgi:peptide/nickel transport system substrate-binding protein
LVQELSRQKIGRREFMNRALALGMSTAAASSLMGRAAKADTPQKGGHLVLGIDNASTSDSIDPVNYTSTYIQCLGPQFYNSLVELDVHNTAQPSLATSWEAKPGAAVWIVKLRKGVTFHNGKEMEAADVIYSINHHRGKDSKSGAKASLEQISDLAATDKYELTFTLSAGNADLPYILADYHLGIMPDGAPYDKGIGTGAFILETFEPGPRALTKRNPNYWNPDRGFVDSVETVAINDPTARISALQSGAVHLVNRVSPKVFALLKSNPKLATYEISGAAHYTFPMRCDTAPFDNKDVRLALKYAVDREEIIKRVLGGHGKVANDQPIASFDPFYAADLPQHGYDPDKARFHMKQAGFDGTIPLSVADVAFVGCTDAGVLMQASAAKAGIKIDVTREPNDGYWDNVWQKKPFCTSEWLGRPTADGVMTFEYAADSNQNDTFWKNPRFNELLTAARSELDQKKRAEMYAECQQLMHDDNGVIVIMFTTFVTANSDKVSHGKLLSSLDLDGFRLAQRWWHV